MLGLVLLLLSGAIVNVKHFLINVVCVVIVVCQFKRIGSFNKQIACRHVHSPLLQIQCILLVILNLVLQQFAALVISDLDFGLKNLIGMERGPFGWLCGHRSLRRLRWNVKTKHSLMVDQNTSGKSLENPRVLQRFERCDSRTRIPLEALNNEVKECLALVPNYFVKRPRTWQSQASITVFHDVQWLICTGTEEFIFSLSVF